MQAPAFKKEDEIMKKLCALILLGLIVTGMFGCQEDNSMDSMMKDVDNAASDVPKDHPAH